MISWPRVREAEADDDVRAVLLTGEGRAFSAGQDLSDPAVSGEGADLGALLAERYNPIILALRTIPKPVVVAVNGTAAGAGANVALAGDVVLAARSAKFIQAFSKIGLMPDSRRDLDPPPPGRPRPSARADSLGRPHHCRAG